MRPLYKALVSLVLSFPVLLIFSSYSPALTAPASSYSFLINEPMLIPWRVATDGAGNIYIADLSTRRVTVFDPAGKKKFAIPGADALRSVAVDYRGNILVGYMTDGQPGYVIMYGPSGQVIRMLGSGYGEFSNPTSIAVSYQSGRIYVADGIGNVVKVYESDGNNALLSSGSPFIFGGYGQLIDNSILSNPGKFYIPGAITVDNIRQEVLVGDRGNHRVQIFDMNGSFKTAIGKAYSPYGVPSDFQGKFGMVAGLNVDIEGRIYVADAGFGCVQVLDRMGNFLGYIGSAGYAPGRTYQPYDVVITNQHSLVVVDASLQRATVFAIDTSPALPNVAPTEPKTVMPEAGAVLTVPDPTLTIINSSDLNGDALVYSFQIDISPSFDSNNLISLTVPAGVSSTSLHLSPLPQGTYFWRVRAEESSTPERLTSAWSSVGSFTVYLNKPPSAPTQAGPANGSTLTTANPTLSANSAIDPNGDDLIYRFQIDATSSFTSGSVITLTSSSTSVVVPSLPQGVFFWRVRAEESATTDRLTSDWSVAGRFTVYLNKPPMAPALASPAAGSILTIANPTLSINSSNDPNGDALVYRFQVDTSSSFTSSNLITLTSSSTTVSVPSLAQGAYFWRARAEESATSDHLTSDWSVAGSFTVYLNKPPTVPSNLRPDIDALVKKTDSISWQASTDPNPGDRITYVIELSEQANFAGLLASQAGLTTTAVEIETFYRRALLKADAKYFWRVRAVDSDGASSAWSTTGSFIFTETRLFINSTPDGALVYLDGNYSYLGAYVGQTGKSPVALVDIRPGRHVVRIERPGYFGYYASVVIPDGGSYTLNAALKGNVSGIRTFKGALRDDRGIAIGAGLPRIAEAKPFMVDWNNDGKKDMLVGSASGRVFLYLNKGTDATPIFSLSSIHPQGVLVRVSNRAAPFVADWNNDGRKDLLVGSGDGLVWAYINQGSDDSPAFGVPSPITTAGAALRVSGNAAPFIVDWNGDRKKDLLVGESSGGVRLYLNAGSDSEPQLTGANYVVRSVVQSQKNAAAKSLNAVPFACDWDHDGKKDLLVGTSADLMLYLNTNADNAPLFNAAGKVRLGKDNIAPSILDLENDGYPDVLAGVANGQILYYPFRVMTGNPQHPLIKAQGKSATSGSTLYKWW